MIRQYLVRDVRNRRDVVLFMATITGVSMIAAVALDVFLQLWVLGQPIDAAVKSWIGTMFITILVAGPVTRVIGLAYLELHHARQEVHRQSRTDELTGLPNRRSFLEAARAAEPDGMTVALLDIDHFKAINDGYGHSVGDEVIRCTADVLRRTMGERAAVFRVGGEEFCVLAPMTAPEDAFALLEAARLAVQSTRARTAKGDIWLTISAGVCEARPGEDHETAYARADLALYAAKRAGRNRVHLQVGDRRIDTVIDLSDDLVWQDAASGPTGAAVQPAAAA